jgi:hypothetical protein
MVVLLHVLPIWMVQVHPHSGVGAALSFCLLDAVSHLSDAEEIPRVNSYWRWEDQEQAPLSRLACSSLSLIELSEITIHRSRNFRKISTRN